MHKATKFIGDRHDFCHLTFACNQDS